MVQRCAECGEIIDPDEDFKEGIDDPERCEMCND